MKEYYEAYQSENELMLPPTEGLSQSKFADDFPFSTVIAAKKLNCQKSFVSSKKLEDPVLVTKKTIATPKNDFRLIIFLSKDKG
jgi:hypothetical protein